MAFSEFLWKPLSFFYRLCLILKVLHQKPLSFFTLSINYEILHTGLIPPLRSTADFCTISTRYMTCLMSERWKFGANFIYWHCSAAFFTWSLFPPLKKKSRIQKVKEKFDSVMKASSCGWLSQSSQWKTRAKTRKIASFACKIANFCNFHRKKFWEKIPL